MFLALFRFEPGKPADALPLADRLRAHVLALAPPLRDHDDAREPLHAARYIEQALREDGYHPRRVRYMAAGRPVQAIEVSVANLAPGAEPVRSFLVGALHASHAGLDGAGPAAVLALAQLLRDVQPARGTELRFIFLVDDQQDLAAPPLRGASPGPGSFLAYEGSLESSSRVRQALAVFRSTADLHSHGLAARAHGMGLKLSARSSPGQPGGRALLFTDTSFLHYPYQRAQGAGKGVDCDEIARVVDALARTIATLASPERT